MAAGERIIQPGNHLQETAESNNGFTRIPVACLIPSDYTEPSPWGVTNGSLEAKKFTTEDGTDMYLAYTDAYLDGENLLRMLQEISAFKGQPLGFFGTLSDWEDEDTALMARHALLGNPWELFQARKELYIDTLTSGIDQGNVRKMLAKNLFQKLEEKISVLSNRIYVPTNTRDASGKFSELQNKLYYDAKAAYFAYDRWNAEHVAHKEKYWNEVWDYHTDRGAPNYWHRHVDKPEWKHPRVNRFMQDAFPTITDQLRFLHAVINGESSGFSGTSFYENEHTYTCDDEGAVVISRNNQEMARAHVERTLDEDNSTSHYDVQSDREYLYPGCVLIPTLCWKNDHGKRSWHTDFLPEQNDGTALGQNSAFIVETQQKRFNGQFDSRRLDPLVGMMTVAYLSPDILASWQRTSEMRLPDDKEKQRMLEAQMPVYTAMRGNELLSKSLIENIEGILN